MSSKEFVCKNCGESAYNSSIFRDKEPPYTESMHCPKCKGSEITTKRLFKFEMGWRLIIESGLKDKVQQIPGAYIKLSEKDEKTIKLGNMRIKDVPPEIAIELQNKMSELQEIVKKSGILNDLDENGVTLNLNVSA